MSLAPKLLSAAVLMALAGTATAANTRADAIARAQGLIHANASALRAGTQDRFQTRDDSTNNWWVALLSFGEGWHNNHHAHPVSARHGLAWYELDVNWIGISLLKALGLAWDVKVAKMKQAVPYEENDRLAIVEEEEEEAVA